MPNDPVVKIKLWKFCPAFLGTEAYTLAKSPKPDGYQEFLTQTQTRHFCAVEKNWSAQFFQGVQSLCMVWTCCLSHPIAQPA